MTRNAWRYAVAIDTTGCAISQTAATPATPHLLATKNSGGSTTAASSVYWVLRAGCPE